MPAPPQATPQERRRFWLLLLIALVMLGAGIGLRDPWPSDEPRFTLAAAQMVASGDWLFPHRGIELYADKPPMLMWLEAASFELVRNWRIAFMLPSLLAGLGTLLLVYDLGRRLWNRRTGLYAAGALLLAFQFVYQGQRAQIDPLVVFFITAANWGLLHHLLAPPDAAGSRTANWPMYWLGCFCAGLGVITKGVGFLALLMLLPYAWAAWRGWDGVARPDRGAWWRWLLGLAAALAAIALWLVPMLLVAHARADDPAYPAYVRDILFHQTAQRYADAWHHIHPWWYYIPIVLFSWLPLSLTYPGSVPRWRRQLQAGDARILLPLGWVLLVLIFFSASAGKRDVYVLPMLPMVALLTAPFLDDLLRTRWLRASGLLFIALMGSALLLVGGYALLSHSPWVLRFALRHELADGGAGLWWMCVTIGAVQLLLVAALRMRRAVLAVAGGMAALWLGWGCWGVPLLNASSSASGLMTEVRSHLDPGDQIGLVAWKEQNLLMLKYPAVDFGFKVPWHIQFALATRWQAQAPATRWLFVQQPAMGDCVNRTKAIYLGHANQRDWWMFKADAVTVGCTSTNDETPNQPANDPE
ncbi:glycosyltransferase family 39 protein [Dyella sp. A6]|uniref:ArnT family glycosyltransferase n=1 Tax=Dyella aluminiiresistens TaxID=3069105 RepID=UPI002E79B1F3|nr:glycosyltransferase family 39 protein [Dyella sp. A6]